MTTGTELSIEQTQWAHMPPTREDMTKAKMLIVKAELEYNSGVAGVFTNAAEFYTFMSAPPAGTGYPAQFGTIPGNRGKYFVFDAKTDTKCAPIVFNSRHAESYDSRMRVLGATASARSWTRSLD